jgi:hypothetical protein
VGDKVCRPNIMLKEKMTNHYPLAFSDEYYQMRNQKESEDHNMTMGNLGQGDRKEKVVDGNPA